MLHVIIIFCCMKKNNIQITEKNVCDLFGGSSVTNVVPDKPFFFNEVFGMKYVIEIMEIN